MSAQRLTVYGSKTKEEPTVNNEQRLQAVERDNYETPLNSSRKATEIETSIADAALNVELLQQTTHIKFQGDPTRTIDILLLMSAYGAPRQKQKKAKAILPREPRYRITNKNNCDKAFYMHP